MHKAALVTLLSIATALPAAAQPALDGSSKEPGYGKHVHKPGIVGLANEQAVITIGADAYDMLRKAPGVLPAQALAKSLARRDRVVALQVPAADLPGLSEFMHEKTGRCPGFIYHATLEEALIAMDMSERAEYKAAPVDYVINQKSLATDLLADLDQNNIYSTINHLSTAFPTRFHTTTTGTDASVWIRDLWQGYAAGRSDVSVSLYSHPSSVTDQPSVVMTIQGATTPDEVVVMGGHMDSTVGSSTPTATAPGADDNASGIAVLSEIIRVLMLNNVTPDRTLKFMAYAAEEVGLRGSGDIAQQHLDDGINVTAVLQFDMTGFNGSAEDFVFIDDYTNAALTTFTSDLVDTYLPEYTWTTTTCNYGCSDHASWHNRGFPAVFPFEARFNERNFSIHSINDTLATLGDTAAHAFKFSRLGTLFAVEASTFQPQVCGASDSATGLSGSKRTKINRTFEVDGCATSVTFTLSGGSGDADLFVRYGSTPTNRRFDCSSTNNGNEETCTITNPQAGTWYVQIKSGSNAGFSGVSFNADYQ